MVADLHLHTFFSDGTYSPEELAGHGHRVGLSALALTDHDTVDGCARAEAACRALGIEFIPGTELTAEHRNREVHVLGYWLDPESPALLSRLAGFQAVRENRIRDMVHRLNERGIALKADDVFRIANCKSPGRPHVARALVEGGFCGDYDQAFERFLKKGRPGWVPKARMDIPTTVGLIHAAGGVAVLAHPGLYHDDTLIPEIAEAGLDGLECWHSRHHGTEPVHYERLAAELGLVATGGSDCHGMSKGEPLIGRIQLPYAQVEALKARRPAGRSASTS